MAKTLYDKLWENHVVHQEADGTALLYIDRLKKELIDAKYESLTVSEELMQMSRQSYVIDKLREQGSNLEVSTEPAVVINR
jgi:homoaconitase/3-isopropylmalate dehydratase large subunit